MRILLSALLLMLVVLAEACPAAARQVALVVGNTRYDKLAELVNPRRDAAAVSDRFRNLGFEVTEAFDADAFSLQRAVDTFLRQARGADLALFYFAGHGMQLFDRNFLLARDVDPATTKEASGLGIDLSDLIRRLGEAGPVRQAFLIDACRDNPLTFDQTVALMQRLPGHPATGQGAALLARSVKRSGLANVALPAGQAVSGGRRGAETLIFFAAQPGNVSDDGRGQNSYFVEGLKEALADGKRPLMDAFRQVSAYVRTVTNGNQVPQIVSDWTQDVSLGGKSAAKITYNVRPAGDRKLTAAEEALVIRAATGYTRFKGDFIARASTGSTDNHDLTDAERARAKALGTVNGFSIAYDLDRDGRDEVIHVYFRQVNHVLVIEKDGVRMEVASCLADAGEINDIEVALRDINGDRKPELWIATDDGNVWSRFCIIEFKGLPNLDAKRRANTGQSFAGYEAFRTLLRNGPSAWDIAVANDNSIKACAGSNCHSPTAYSFDGERFTMTASQGSEPKPHEAQPFRDEADRARQRYASLLGATKSINSQPLSWTLQTARMAATATAQVSPTITLAYRCNVLGDGALNSEGLALKVAANPSRDNRLDVEIDETLAYGEVLGDVPLLIGNASCPVTSIASSDVRGIEIQFAPEQGAECAADIGRGGLLTLPLVYRDTGLVRIDISHAQSAISAARRACTKDGASLANLSLAPTPTPGTSSAPAKSAPAQPAPPAAGKSPATPAPVSGLERFVADRFLAPNDTSAAALAALYAATVDYYGKPQSRDQIVREKQRYFARWPQRRYDLTPGTMAVTAVPGRPSQLVVTFDYTFEVQSPTDRRAGRGRTTLIIDHAGGERLIHAEKGEVLRRN